MHLEVRFSSGDKAQPQPLCISLFKLLMNEKYSVNPSAVPMAFPRNHLSPLGTSEDSSVIKVELHSTVIQASLCSQSGKRKEGEWKDGIGGMRPLQRRRLKSEGLGVW